MHKQRKFILIAAAVGAIATFLPWFSISAGAFGYNVSNSRNGLHDAGIFYLVFCITAGAVSLLGDQVRMLEKNMRLIVTGSGVMALVSLVIAYSQIESKTDSGYGMVSLHTGVGFILACVAALAVIAVPLLIKGAGESLGSDLSNLKSTLSSLQGDASAPRKDRMAELEKLIAMKNEGQITMEEYEQLKSKII